LLHFPYLDLYRKQVVKQADLVLAMHLCGDTFTPEQKARNFAYYEALTVRDSSLSSATQAVLAAECGHLDLAHDYLGEAALIDLNDLQNNSRDGLHLASLAGAWIALVDGFGGMRAKAGKISFAPRLPSGISRLAFRVQYRGRCVKVSTTGESVTYELMWGQPLPVAHHGGEILLGEEPVSRPVDRPPPAPPPRQPRGRAPRRRHVGGARDPRAHEDS
jgi:alpha,alpha-trehalose phosphorylase